MTEFINDQFYETLVSMIKKEVARLIENNDVLKDIKCNDTIDSNSKEINYLNTIIKTQSKDIEFLRAELCNKNEIITTLLNDNIATHNAKDRLDVNTSGTSRSVTDLVSNVCDNNSSNNYTEVKRNININKQVGEQPKKRSIAILGDSTIRDIEQYKVRNALGGKLNKVYVKSFSGATTEHMKSHAIPTKSFNNDLIILHCGTNDLRSSKSARDIAKEIHDLASDLKTETNDVIVSGIVPRNDKEYLDTKGRDVNMFLKSLCVETNFYFIDNSNVKFKHLNSGKLHLNVEGNYILGTNFVKAINI